MSPVAYDDLLWDFDYRVTRGGEEVSLRVFRSDEELYASKVQVAGAVPITLPLASFSGTKQIRADWSHSLLTLGNLLELGRRLWVELPPEATVPLLTATVEKPCRLKISSNSSAIDDLPWEWLNDGSGPPFAMRPECRLVRSVPLSLPLPSLTVTPPIKVLLVLTIPKDEQQSNATVEINAVSQRLTLAPYELQILQEPTWEALTDALREQPHILHYIGHAGIDRGEGCLILRDEANHTLWVSGAKLAKVLSPTLRLLCLSTCFTVPNYQILGLTRLAHLSAQTQLPTILTNLYPITEPTVQSFWHTFYSSLVQHLGNFNEAFHDAQRSFVDHYATQTDWGSFSLVLRDGSGEVMRLQEAGTESIDTYAAELQAQYASRLANELAERAANFGEETNESVRKGIEEEKSRARGLSKDLYGEMPE